MGGGRHPRWRANPTNRLHIHTLGVHMSLDWGRNPEERGGHANSTHAWRRPWRSEATVLTTKSPCPLISHQSCFGYIVLQSTAKKQKILQDASRVPIWTKNPQNWLNTMNFPQCKYRRNFRTLLPSLVSHRREPDGSEAGDVVKFYSKTALTDHF